MNEIVEQQNKELIEKILSPLNDDENMSYFVFSSLGNIDIFCKNIATVEAVKNIFKIDGNMELLKQIEGEVVIRYSYKLK